MPKKAQRMASVVQAVGGGKDTCPSSRSVSRGRGWALAPPRGAAVTVALAAPPRRPVQPPGLAESHSLCPGLADRSAPWSRQRLAGARRTGGRRGHAGRDARCRRGDRELIQQQLVIPCRLRVARQDQAPPVHGRQMDIHHPNGRELLQNGARRESGRARPGQVPQGDVQAVGHEGDEDVRLDPFPALMEYRTDGEVVLDVLERLLDLREPHVVAPQRRRVLAGQVGAQQVAALAAPGPAQPDSRTTGVVSGSTCSCALVLLCKSS